MKTEGLLLKAVFIGLFMVLFCIGGKFSACAADTSAYQITNCHWEVGDDGRIFAVWDEPEKPTTYNISIFYYLDEDCTDKKTLLKYKRIDEASFDCTELILKTGAYLYYFRVNPAKGKNENGDESDVLCVTQDMMTKVKKLGSKPTVAADGTITSFVISAKESGDPGTVRSLAIRDTTNATVTSLDFSKPADQWKPGEQITINVTYKARDGYRFSGSTSYQCKRAEIISQTGNDSERSFVLRYVPRCELEAPEGVYLSKSGTLMWNPVDNAGRYNVQFYYDGEKEDSKIYSGVTAEISDYISGLSEKEELTVRVFAIGAAGATEYFLSSDPTALVVSEENTFTGDFRPSRIPPTYENGMPANGWTQISGKWFYFVEGVALCSGWWTNPSDGNKYYFSKYGIMQTGKISVDGKEYVLNDGSDQNRPLGALIK